MSRRALTAVDLFCGPGGASAGLLRGGFARVVGVDHDLKALRQHAAGPCGDAVLGDALAPPLDLRAADFVWASPPCAPHSLAMRYRRAHSRHRCRIAETRALIRDSGVPGVIENVPGAPIRPDIVLNGATFGLPIVRRRHFEAVNWTAPLVLNSEWAGKTVTNGALKSVAGHGFNNPVWGVRWTDHPKKFRDAIRESNSLPKWQEAMDIGWVQTKNMLVRAVPPAYAAFIAALFLNTE